MCGFHLASNSQVVFVEKGLHSAETSVIRLQLHVAVRYKNDEWRVSHVQVGTREMISPLRRLESAMVVLETRGGHW